MNTLEESLVRMVAHPTGEKLKQRLWICLAAYAGKIQQRCKFRSKDEALMGLCVIERLYAERVTRKYKNRVVSIQDGEAKHPNETWE
jgi:hypothetical protein